MTLRLPDHWVWDFWTADDGDRIHVFFLHAPRALGDPELRHVEARIGHAVSGDLRTWHVLPEALGPSVEPRFDDRAVWTGSVIRHGNEWLMFYTGISRQDPGLVQRIGMATSRDLQTWRRTGVRIEADPRWYEKAGDVSTQEHWRDPWAIRTPNGAIHLLITARAPGGPSDERGVVGHAWSRDLVDWTIEPPITQPGAFRQLEVPQVLEAGGRWHLIASFSSADHAARRRSEHGFAPLYGTLVASADTPLGPFDIDASRSLLGDLHGSLYAARLVPWQGALKLLAWRNIDANGRFVGELADPIDVRVTDTGDLEVDSGSAALARRA